VAHITLLGVQLAYTKSTLRACSDGSAAASIPASTVSSRCYRYFAVPFAHFRLSPQEIGSSIVTAKLRELPENDYILLGTVNCLLFVSIVAPVYLVVLLT
jgi:hypothetical protein